jgi:hypothetical protein
MVDLLSAGQRDAVIAPLLRDRLEPLGLSEIAPRRWIDGSKLPARPWAGCWAVSFGGPAWNRGSRPV